MSYFYRLNYLDYIILICYFSNGSIFWLEVSNIGFIAFISYALSWSLCIVLSLLRQLISAALLIAGLRNLRKYNTRTISRALLLIHGKVNCILIWWQNDFAVESLDIYSKALKSICLWQKCEHSCNAHWEHRAVNAYINCFS